MTDNKTWYYWHEDGLDSEAGLASSLGESDDKSVAVRMASVCAKTMNKMIVVREMPSRELVTNPSPDVDMISAAANTSDLSETSRIANEIEQGKENDAVRLNAGLPDDSWRVPYFILESSRTGNIFAFSKDEKQIRESFEYLRDLGNKVRLRCSVGWKVIDG